MASSIARLDGVISSRLSALPDLISAATAAVRATAVKDIVKQQTMGHTSTFGWTGVVLGDWMANNRTWQTVDSKTLLEYGCLIWYGVADTFVHLLETPAAVRVKWVNEQIL